MPQVRKGTVQLTNGSATVRHVWALIVGTISAGPFVAGETVTWAGGGSGVFVKYLSGTSALYLYRTAGPAPDAGTALTGGGSGATTTVVERASGSSPPGWTGGGIAIGDWFVAETGGRAVYAVGGSIAEDSFALSASFVDASAVDISYAIARDRTALYGWPILASGDMFALALLGRALADIETTVRRELDLVQSITPAGGAAAITWKAGYAAEITLNAAPVVLSFVAPYGPARLRLRLKQDGSGSRTVTWPGSVIWPGGTAPTLTPTADRSDLIDLDWDGVSTYRGHVVAQNFAS